QLQGFCRDLHSECVDFLVQSIVPAALRSVLREEFRFNRSLDRGNANPSAIGSDFGRLGVNFWRQVYAQDPRNARRRERLEELNRWRNAIAHHDFDPVLLRGHATLHPPRVRSWRRVCSRLARAFDDVLLAYLTTTTGTTPW